MYRIDFGKDYRAIAGGGEVIGFFVYDPCSEVDFPYLLVERKTYRVINGFTLEEEALETIVDPKIEFAKIVSNYPRRKKKAVIDANREFCLSVLDEDDDYCVALIVKLCTEDEISILVKMCELFEVELDWLK